MPVLSRPSAKPKRSSVAESPSAGCSPTRPAGILLSPIWISPRRNVPVVRTVAAAESRRPPAMATPADAPAIDQEVVGFAFDHGEVRGSGDLRLHGPGVELAVGLGPGPAHRRALAAVEQAELDPGAVGDPAHEAVESVDLAHQVALAEAADGRVARHRADRRDAVGHERGARADARRGGGGLAAGMPAADHDDVEAVHQGLSAARDRRRRRPGQTERTDRCFT